jgi:hypothetical protein
LENGTPSGLSWRTKKTIKLQWYVQIFIFRQVEMIPILSKPVSFLWIPKSGKKGELINKSKYELPVLGNLNRMLYFPAHTQVVLQRSSDFCQNVPPLIIQIAPCTTNQCILKNKIYVRFMGVG